VAKDAWFHEVVNLLLDGSKRLRKKLLMSRRYVLIACVLLALFLIPFPTGVVPEWKLRVLDRDGNPISGERVRETWQHYSLEGDGHEDERLTDQNGYVVFPARKIWSPLLWRIVSTGSAAVSTLFHGGMGVHAWVMVIGYSTTGGTRSYEPGQPLPSEIVLTR
jgi:hypothetical protein